MTSPTQGDELAPVGAIAHSLSLAETNEAEEHIQLRHCFRGLSEPPAEHQSAERKRVLLGSV
ncbi:MAG: hypothetical protein JWP31_1375 [Aeromicrobium sp.]|nr:hypothetical protein [Aeromicrobium sp.]